MGIPCAGLHSHYCPLSALLPLLLLLTLVFPCTNGSGVGEVQPVHSTSSGGGGNATKRSFFPEGFRPMPERDELAPNSTQEEPDELIYLSEYIRNNLVHLPLAFNIGFQVFAGLQFCDFSSSGIRIHPFERESLQAHLRQKGLLSRFAPHTVSSSELLPQLIQGNSASATTEELHDFLDRYFVAQIGSGPLRQTLCDAFVALLHVSDVHQPLVVDMYNTRLSQFTLWCLYYRSHALKTATRKFILVGSEGDEPSTFSFFEDHALNGYPQINISYLLHHPLLVHFYSVNGNIRHPKFTPLPLGFLFFHRTGDGIAPVPAKQNQDDTTKHLTHMKLYLKGLDLHKVFPHIQHELRFGRVGAVWLETALEMFAGGTTDPPVEWIPLEQLPERVTTVYVVLMPLEREKREGRPSLTSEVLVFRSESGNRATAAAQHVALLPFTAALYHKLQQHPFGSSDEREFKILNGLGVVQEWRKPVHEYLLQHADISVQLQHASREEYYAALQNFTFAISPMGYGYECYRTWEILVMGGIPILQNPTMYLREWDMVGSKAALNYGMEVNARGLIDLYHDLPVVFIEDASDMTMHNMRKWQQRIRENTQRGEYKWEKLFMQYWIDRIYGHTNYEP